MKTASILALLIAAAPAAARVPDPAECEKTLDLKRAITCYTAIIDSFSSGTPSSHKVLMYRFRALLYANGDMPDKALADYTKAIKLDGGLFKGENAKARLLCERAYVYAKLGEHKKALSDHRACVAAGNAWANEGVGETLAKLGDLAGAIRHFTRAIDSGQRYGYVYRKRAEAYRLSGEKEKAENDAEKAVEMDPEDLAALYLRAKTRLNSGNAQGALDDLARLEQLTGHNNEYSSYRGLANYLLGNRSAAENFLKAALDAHTDSREVKLSAACYWWGLKQDAAKARETLQKYGSPEGAPAGMEALAECLKKLP